MRYLEYYPTQNRRQDLLVSATLLRNACVDQVCETDTWNILNTAFEQVLKELKELI
jgi:hypothetical protein